MPHRRPRCPKCQGQLYLEQGAGTRHVLSPEWACLQCGWRRTYTPRQFTRTFALAVEDGDDLATRTMTP